VSSNRPDGVARLKQILLIHGGWEVRKNPVVGEVFFLDFPFYRTFLSEFVSDLPQFELGHTFLAY
jgi:hypothetical protein